MFTLTAQDRHGILLAGRLPGAFDQNGLVYDCSGISPTATTMQGGHKTPKILIREATTKGYAESVPGDSINFSHPESKTRRGRVDKQIANTILTSCEQAVVQIRKLPPLECWRLMTFPDWAFLAAKFGSKTIAQEIIDNELDHYTCEYPQVVSDSQLYKQAGNSVIVEIVYEKRK